MRFGLALRESLLEPASSTIIRGSETLDSLHSVKRRALGVVHRLPGADGRSKLEAAKQVRRPPRLGEEVYRIIYSQLMSLKIPPGGRISVDGLSRELGVSQTPIRDALSRLEAQGLVIKAHLVGYSAAEQMSRSRFEQLYELRFLLEPFAAANAARNINNEGIRKLKKIIDKMETISNERSRLAFEQFAPLDSEFHNCIAINSHNELVADTLARLHTHVHLFRLVFRAGTASAAFAEHKEIFSGIERHDPGSAEEAMRTHLAESKRRFIDAV